MKEIPCKECLVLVMCRLEVQRHHGLAPITRLECIMLNQWIFEGTLEIRGDKYKEFLKVQKLDPTKW